MNFTGAYINSHNVMLVILCMIIGLIWSIIPHPAVILPFCIAPFAIYSVIKMPFQMVLLFVIFSFFRIHEVFPQLYPLKIPLLLSLASIFSLGWHIVLTKQIKPYWRPELNILAFFFILVLIGVFAASNRPIAMAYFKGIYWKVILMTIAIAWLTTTPKDFSFASKSITISGCIVGIVALLNKANGIGLVEGTRVTIGRDIGSMLGDPNDLALVLMFPIAFAVSITLTPRISHWYRLFGIVSTVLLISAVIATQSRGGLLGMMSIFGIFGYRRIKSKALFFGGGAFLIMILYLAAGISDRSSGGAAEEGIDESAMGRIYAWEAAFGMGISNPLTGVGIDNFYSNYYFYSSHWDGLNHAVHSTWFGVFAETGVLGFLVFITLIGSLIKTALLSLNAIESHLQKIDPAMHITSQATLAGLVSVIVSGTFLTQGFTWPIYILCALVVALAHWVKTELSEQTIKN